MKTSRVHDEPAAVTGEDLASMGSIGRSELVRGRLVRASPTSQEHGGVEGNFYHELRSFVAPRHLGKVRVGEVGIYTRRSPDTVRAADVLFMSSGRYACCRRKGGFLEVAPELVVEVVSPSDSRADLEEKIGEYFQCGVLLVWVADPASRTVRVHTSVEDVRVLGDGDVLDGGDVLPGFGVPVGRLFED